MSSLIFVVSIVAILLPAALAHRFRRLESKHSAFLVAALLALGVALLEVVLVLTALPTLLRTLQLSALADLCEQLLGHSSPANVVIGWAAAGLAAFLAVLIGRSLRQARTTQKRLRVEAWVGDHERRGDYELVLLPAAEPFAFSLPGHQPQVIVSTALVSELSGAEFEAVVRHERAQLDLRHGRFMLLGAVVRSTLGWIPVVRTSVHLLTASLERWADEASVATMEDRDNLHGALRNVAAVLAHPAVAHFSRAETIVERLEALRSPRLSSRPVVMGLVGGYAVLAAIAMISVADWIGHAHALVASVPYCPV